MREIPIVGMRGSGGSSAPLQVEALNYFARMTTPPSAAFRVALNEAVYRWKKAGLWALIAGLWLGATDTHQAGLLSVIGDTPRDAVVVGAAPPHTPLKGWSGFDATHRIKFPITAAILASDAVVPFLAARLEHRFGDWDGDPETGDNYYRGALIQSDAGVGSTTPGNFVTAGPSHLPGALTFMNGSMTFGGAESLVVGYKMFGWVLPGNYGASGGGSNDGRSSNYITQASAGGPLNRLCAYGFLTAAASQAQAAKFLAILSNLLDQLGALD